MIYLARSPNCMMQDRYVEINMWLLMFGVLLGEMCVSVCWASVDLEIFDEAGMGKYLRL